MQARALVSLLLHQHRPYDPFTGDVVVCSSIPGPLDKDLWCLERCYTLGAKGQSEPGELSAVLVGASVLPVCSRAAAVLGMQRKGSLAVLAYGGSLAEANKTVQVINEF
eukprot:scaffold6605_cov22-Tisochrysis_lutea.AAC.4